MDGWMDGSIQFAPMPLRFKWSRASTFSYIRNAIGLAFAYASAIHTHLSVHGTAHPMSDACVLPRSEADCLIRSAVDISHPRQQGNSRADLSAASGPVRSNIVNGLGACEDGGDHIPSLSPRMATGVFPGAVAAAPVPLSTGRGFFLPTQSQELYRRASSGPLACRPLALMRPMRKPMYARMLTLQPGMPT